MTSRELADTIDKLIVLRIKDVLEGDSAKFKGIPVKELCETTVRMIADGLLRLDHNPGVAVVRTDPPVVGPRRT